ncbi:MAG: methyl-accepting chemotaxis protein [Methanomicrobium sp.]|nr:methyl-accepting chemotaxis protein [Methanomicrobium sp.]
MALNEIKAKVESFLNGNTDSRIDLKNINPENTEIAALFNRLMAENYECHKEKEFFYDVIINAPVAMLLFNKNLEIVDSNEGFYEMSGYSNEKVKGYSLSNLHSEFKLELLDGKSSKDALESRQKVSGKFYMTFKGERKIIEIHSIPVIDKEGKVTHVNTVLVDISLVENQKAWYESILDSIPFPISVTDLNMNWTYLNPKVSEMAGISKKDGMGTPCNRWNAEICKTKKCGVESLRRGENKTYFEQNGRDFMVDVAWIQDATGDNVGHIEIIQDITEIKLLEKRADTFVKNNPLGITVLGSDKKRLDLNKEFQRLWRGSYEELMNKKLYDFNVETKGDDFYASFETKRNAMTDMTVSWEDGTKTYLRLFQNPILNNDGEIDVNYYLYQDMTSEMARSIYMDEEVNKIAADLENIALGKPENLKLKVGEADIHTRDLHDRFGEITKSVSGVNESLSDLLKEVQNIAESGSEGKLDYRADVGRFRGAYAVLVSGLNELLESVDTPLREAMSVCKRYSNADFQARFSDSIDVSGDFLDFKTEVDNIGVSVSELLMESVKVTKMIVSNSNEVSKGTDEVSRAAEGVANTSQKTADLTRDLLVNIEDVNRQIADLSASNEEIASTSQEVYNAANEVVSIGKEAQHLGNDANKKMVNVEKIAQESVEEIRELTEKVKEVGKVVKLINDITGQINLLALNAAIEAARAGEHGRGFAVVAGEVKNLAGEARAATDSIEKVVSMVQTSSEKTSGAITSANNEIIEGVDSVTKAIESLNSIIKSAGQVTNDIGEITKAIEDQANISNNVVKAMDAGTRQTKDVQKEAQELAALAEEASASIEEIGSAMHEVNTYVHELEEANSKFKY